MATGNDQFSAATVIIFDDLAGGTYSSGTVNLTTNTVEAGEYAPYSGSKSAWWRYTPTVTGTMHITSSTGDTSYSLVSLTILRGTEWESLSVRNTFFATGDGDFSVTEGLTYYIQATGFYGRLVGGLVETGGQPGDYVYDKEQEQAPITFQFTMSGPTTRATLPEITVQPQSQTVQLGAGAVQFDAAAIGRPTPTARFQQKVPNGSWEDIYEFFAVTWIVSPDRWISYWVTTPTLADSGTKFRVRFTNIAGETYTAEATLTVTPGLPTLWVKTPYGQMQEIATADDPLFLKAPDGRLLRFNGGGGPLSLRVLSPEGQWELISTVDSYDYYYGSTPEQEG